MEKLIRNNWRRAQGELFEKTSILNHEIHPEGFDFDRIRFIEAGRFTPDPTVGHILSVIRGNGRLHLANDPETPLQLEAGVHLYLPPELGAFLDAKPGFECLQVAAASPSQARGKKLILRDETFLAACAHETQSLRWAFTPQYLSRRIFLHHDQVLVSKSGNPVSWYRTTMFDVAGLPKNQDGIPVFKMSYNSRTECNVCCEVKGTARVRMAQHPYQSAKQLWSPWFPLDGDSTYHLNEAAGCPEEECRVDDATRTPRFYRNRHEVFIDDGYVTLFCMFDPAPTGVENHRPGEYSDYEPLSQVLGTKAYETQQREIARYDEMVDQLSLAKARGTLSTLKGSAAWELYLRGREAQLAIEAQLVQSAVGKERERVLNPWMQRFPTL